MPVIVPLAADPASLVSTHKTRHTGATVATAEIPATVAIPATLAREPEFFQSAWDALAPLLLDIGQNLIEHQGFQAAGEANEDILLDLVASMDESALRLRLPTTFADLPHFLPNATQLIRGNHAESAYTLPGDIRLDVGFQGERPLETASQRGE
ncbi:hypothetical protein EHS25_008251 [Saitozyma podzolica]|uniref:Uncharacterized protein n=1 Tax=Saitozyma podzolica TaxID=1890683 RepID=A0A427YNZ6_9TREE|nr:hypothetical protein EHS25_008251 [Saitozyma podzolica]